MIDLTDYQKWTTTTLKPSLLPIGSDSWTEYVGLQLVAETGEVLGKFAKWIRDEGGLLSDLESMSDETAEAVAYELGDLLYFYAQVGLRYDWDLEVPPEEDKFVRVSDACRELGEISSGLCDFMLGSYMFYDELRDDWNEGVIAIKEVAEALGFDLQEIADMNQTKLKDRQERGVLGGSGDQR